MAFMLTMGTYLLHQLQERLWLIFIWGFSLVRKVLWRGVDITFGNQKYKWSLVFWDWKECLIISKSYSVHIRNLHYHHTRDVSDVKVFIYDIFPEEGEHDFVEAKKGPHKFYNSLSFSFSDIIRKAHLISLRGICELHLHRI